MGLWDYNTVKYLKIRSVKLASLQWSIYGIIFISICVMMFYYKEYQKHDNLVSSVTTKMKGVAVTNDNRILLDAADHSALSQGKDSFFVVTNAVVTENQRQGTCSEGPESGTICSSNEDCTKGYTNPKSNGVQTGTCYEFAKTCKVFAWCLTEKRRDAPKPAIFGSAENVTVFIKNNIGFINFNYTKRNILPEMNETYLQNCIFNRTTDPYCPKFRLRDIVQEAGENFTEMAVERKKSPAMEYSGGVIAIQIKWECNLDWLLHKCVPEYSFRRLDEKNSKKTLYPGLNFRFARYYKQNGMEARTLFKVYGIRFDVMVTGKAGKFNLIKLITYIGSTLSYFGLTILVVDFLLTNYIPRCGCKKEVKSYYTEKKYEAVEDQTELQNESTRECPSSPQRPPRRSEDTEMQERQTGACSEEHETSPSWRPMTNLEEELSFHSSTTQYISTPATFSPLVPNRQTSQLLYRNPQLDMPVQVAAATLHLSSACYREVSIQYD